jgi:hypothetical protein
MTLEFKRLCSGAQWRSFAAVDKACAAARTPFGELVLHRGPSSSGGVDATAEGWETWRIELDGRPFATVADLAAPGPTARRRVKRSVRGRLGESELTISGSGALRPAARFVAVEVGERRLVFKPHRLGVVLLDEAGERRAQRRSGEWTDTPADVVEVAAICLFEWGDLEYFLMSPLLALF